MLLPNYFLLKYAARSLKWQGSHCQMLLPTNHKVLPPVPGENVESKLESSKQLTPKDPPKDYEITSPVLLNGEKWRPANNIYSKVSLCFACYFIRRCITTRRLWGKLMCLLHHGYYKSIFYILLEDLQSTIFTFPT